MDDTALDRLWVRRGFQEEGFVIENILRELPPRAKAWFYRTSGGAEIDLLLEVGPRERWAIEVKRSLSSPRPGKGFHLACKDVRANRLFVVYPGEERFRIDPDTEALPLRHLIESGFK